MSVQDKIFRTVRECNTLAEAQNTAAHISLYQLVVVESNDLGLSSFANLPTSSSSVAAAGGAGTADISMQKQCAELLRSGITRNPNRANRSPRYGGVGKGATRLAKSRRGRRQPKAKKSKAPQQQPQNPLPVVARSSNMIPLVSSRLPPIPDNAKPPEDPLAKLKNIEKEIKLLSSRASFRKVMESKLPNPAGRPILTSLEICDVLGANYPSITRREISNGRRHNYDMLAEFDDSHPYLHRASPITLAVVGDPDPGTAEEIAVKHVILHILKIVKEDADISDTAYKAQLRALYDLEAETRERLGRQNRSSGTFG